MNSYRISELARELDVTTRTIRFYEEKGIVTPTRKGQERIYSARDRVSLKLVLRGKRIGFSLRECKELIDVYHQRGGTQKQLERFLEKIIERRSRLEQQMHDIRVMQAELDGLVQRCQGALVVTRKFAPCFGLHLTQ